MRQTIFGNLLNKVKDYENQSVNRKCTPGFIHFSSFTRANSIFCIEDISFCTHFEEEANVHFHLTSVGNLTNTRGPRGQQFKCWGWEETDTFVSFVYCNELGANLPAKFTKFERPKLEKIVQGGEAAPLTRARQLARVYNNSTINSDGLILTEYTPVCLKVNVQRSNTLNVVGARFAVRVVRDNVYIVTGIEYSGPVSEHHDSSNNFQI